jgi:SAM-dependent methyltransferase
MGNIFTLDGTLDSIPLPEDTLDVLVTSNAIGWNLEGELPEIERVLKPGGTAVHLLYMDQQQENPYHEILTSASRGYMCLSETTGKKVKLRYHKTMP